MSGVLHEAVSAQAARRGDAIAVGCGDERLSYAELDARSNRFANTLRGLGCGGGDRVCLFVPKSLDAVVAMLGTLKAGCLYVPIDLSSPAPRLAKIVGSADPSVLVVAPPAERAAAEVLEALPGASSVHVLRLDAAEDADAKAPSVAAALDDGAHILFTSGSTGAPKGVVITHRNVTSFLDWALPYFGIDETDRLSGHAPLHFDLSTFDVYGALTAGAELHLVPPEQSLMPRDLAALIEREALTQWFSVPSVLSYMASFDAVPDGGFESLRRVIWCGDVLPTPVLIQWMRRIPHARYTNLYGPTEATIASSYHTLDAPPEDETAPIPIGRACGGEELLVLRDDLTAAGPEQTGDLYIGGAGLSPGYWRDPEKTASAFVPDPRSPHGDARLYRTGDRARVGADGLVYFLGREDSQVKNRGHRIELGEVEAAVNALGLVREAAVVGIASGDFEGTAICCAFSPEEGAGASAADVRAAVRRELPAYMVPTRWLELDGLPTNPNGKIDRRRLRELFLERAPTRAPSRTP